MAKRAIAILLAGIVAFAGATSGIALAASEGGGTLPQFNPAHFATQLFWLAVSLIAFFFILRNSALPKIEDALESRRRKIDDDLDKASAHREEAEVAMAAYEKALADAAEEAKAIHRQTAQQIAETAAARRSAVAAKLAEETKAAEARIAAAKEPALANLQDVAIEVVQDAAMKIAGLKISNSDAKSAVASSLKENA